MGVEIFARNVRKVGSNVADGLFGRLVCGLLQFRSNQFFGHFGSQCVAHFGVGVVGADGMWVNSRVNEPNVHSRNVAIAPEEPTNMTHRHVPPKMPHATDKNCSVEHTQWS